ncbi:MAG: tryptophan synthase subunit alpha [Clostridiales bacterium]|nr:tryptophan synthase subunit alpha [Clostridiales bacterium]
MNKISNAFKNGKAFIGFVTAGDPDLETSEKIIKSMADAGCNLIEIGIPFSDPLAEGPVIQNANIRSLSAGATTDKVFSLAEKVSAQTDVPLVFMTYLNVIFKYGYERFSKKAKSCGISGFIVPDLPYEEKDELQDVAEKYGISVISLIAPTSKNRIKMIASNAKGFIYEVSSLGVTGARNEIKTDLKSVTDEIKKSANVPVAIGFGINTPRQAAEYSEIADGIIVGSAIVKLVEQYGKDSPQKVFEYVKSMKSAMKN